MTRLEHVPLRALHDQLDQVQGNVPTQRVLAAIGRKQGDTLDVLAERHDVAEKTVRNWLDRFANQPLSAAPYDRHRSGRPPRLPEEDRHRLLEELSRPPTNCGYANDSWGPDLVLEHLASQYDVEYSRRHVYRLLNAARDSHQSERTEYLRDGILFR